MATRSIATLKENANLLFQQFTAGLGNAKTLEDEIYDILGAISYLCIVLNETPADLNLERFIRFVDTIRNKIYKCGDETEKMKSEQLDEMFFFSQNNV